MNKNTERIINKAGSMAIEENKGNVQNWGVLFNTTKEGDEAWTIGRSFLSRWSKFGPLDYEDGAPYYMVEEESYMRNQTGIDIEKMVTTFISQEYHQMIRIPYGNLINFITDNYPIKGDRDKVRIIITANRGIVQPGLVSLLCEYDKNLETKVLTHEQLTRKYLPDKSGGIQSEDLHVGWYYQCTRTINEGDVGLAIAKYRYYKGIEILAYYSSAGYLPDKGEDVVNSTLYDEKQILRMQFLVDGAYEFEPIHLSCNLLYNTLSLYQGFHWLDIWVNNNCMKPVLIVGEVEDPSFPLIETIIHTKNPAMRGDIG